MKKELRILSIKSGTPQGDAFIDWLIKFRYDPQVECPKDKPWDFRAKKEYTAMEQKILDYLHRVNNCPRNYCPIVCSGLRGDGSRFSNKCKYFNGYGWNKDKIFDFRKPQPFVWCSRAKRGKTPINFYSSHCGIKRLALMVAKKQKLIHEFGCADLERTPIEDCILCESKTENGCRFKPGCKKGESVCGLFCDCTIGVCDGCKEKVNKNEK